MRGFLHWLKPVVPAADDFMEKIRASKDSHNISVIYWTNLNWRTKKIYRRLSLRILKDVLRYEKSGRPCKE